jgi:hypothetical protein
MKAILTALMAAFVSLALIPPALAGDREELIKKLGEGKAERDTAGKLTKPEQLPAKKKALNAAIADWNAAYLIAKRVDPIGAEMIKEERAADYRALGEPAQAGQTEEETAGELDKLAQAVKATDPKRAQELFAKVAQKWTQAAADRNAETPPRAANAAADTTKATAATRAAADAAAAAGAATPPGGHP